MLWLYCKNLRREVRFFTLNCTFSNTRSSPEVAWVLCHFGLLTWAKHPPLIFPVQSLLGHQAPKNSFDHEVGIYLLIYFLTCLNQWSRRCLLFFSQELFTLQPVCVFLQGMENLHTKSGGVENELAIALEMLIICLGFFLNSQF